MGGNEQQYIEVKRAGKAVEQRFILLTANHAVKTEAKDHINDNAHQICGGRAPKHMADVLHQGDLAGGRRHDGRVGQRGHLIAEERANDDRAAGHGNGNAETDTNAQKSDACRGQRAPTRTGNNRHDRADQAGDKQEDLRADQLEAPIHHHRDRTASHPHADEDARFKQDDNGSSHALDARGDLRLDIRPLYALQNNKAGDHCGRKQKNNGSIQGQPELTDDDRSQ